MRFLLVLLLATMCVAQPTYVQNTFPTDQNGRPVSVQYVWDSASGSYKATGPSGVLFDRMDGQYVTDVSTSSPSALNITSSFEPCGTVIKNHGATFLKIWFDLTSNPSGASAPDTFWIDPGTSTYFPVSADSVYALEVATAPQMEIQQGRIE